MAKRWTEGDMRFLRDNYKTMPLDEQSAFLERSVTSLMSKARKMGLKRGRYWTDLQKTILFDNLDKTYEELSKLIPDKTLSEITAYCQSKKIRTGSYQKKWSKEEETILRQSTYNKTIEDVYDLIPHRSKDAIRGKLQGMGISVKDEKYWTPYEEDYLRNNLSEKTVYEISIVLNRSEVAIYKKASSLGLILVRDEFVFYNNLSEVFSDYKRLLDGDISRFRKRYNQYYDIILFKYYLKRCNITPTKEWVYNIHFSELLSECKLRSKVKSNWGSSFEFISACFPKYKLKEYNFKTLQVRDGFWLKDYNCYDNIRQGIIEMYANSIIENDAQILDLDLETTYKYFHSSMICLRGIKILYKYLDFYNIPYSNQVYYDNTRFDSMEEMAVYKYIKLNINSNITKYDGPAFYNDLYEERYFPDFILSLNNDKKVIVEYFGMYRESSSSNHSVIENYISKTHRKIEYFKSIKEYSFIDLYSEDLKNNYQGVSQKLASF